MRVLELALAGVLAVTVPIAAQAGVEYGANQRGAGARYRAGLGWRRFRQALGGYRHSQSRPAMEWRRGSAPLGTEPIPARMGSVRLAGCPNVLGLGSQRWRLRLPFADWRGPTGGWGNP